MIRYLKFLTFYETLENLDLDSTFHALCVTTGLQHRKEMGFEKKFSGLTSRTKIKDKMKVNNNALKNGSIFSLFSKAIYLFLKCSKSYRSSVAC